VLTVCWGWRSRRESHRRDALMMRLAEAAFDSGTWRKRARVERLHGAFKLQLKLVLNCWLLIRFILSLLCF
jgi:hypothetical protein